MIAKVAPWLVPGLALVMVGLTLIPAEVWHAPVNDAVYNGFDPNLVYVSPGGGSVDVTKGAVDIAATARSHPTANLATTLLPKLDASVDVSVLDSSGATEPLRIGIWSPWTGSGHFVVFGPGPENVISAEEIVNGSAGNTLLRGDIRATRVLGQYQLGKTYRVSYEIDKADGTVKSRVTREDGLAADASFDRRQFPSMFSNVQLSLTASAVGGDGASHVTLRNYSLVFPHQRAWASKVDDSRVTALMVALAILGVAALLIAGAARAPGALGYVRSRLVMRPVSGQGALWIAAAIALYLVGNVTLYAFGSHPFDMGVWKLYAYVAGAYGPAQLYYLPNFISIASIWGGIPAIESAFPYQAVFAYESTFIGWLNALLFGASPHDVQLEYLIKSVNVLFGLADGILIYAILRQLNASRRWSLIASALFLFNPAVWFSMSVWGQTHVISLCFVLAAVLLAEKNRPAWAWLALVGAFLTRPQMIVFAFLLGIVFLRKFSWSQNVRGLSWTVIATFLFLLPLTLATSPSLPIDVTLHNFSIQESGGNQSFLTTVSQDAYSIWPLVTYAAHGSSGLQRAFTPSSGSLVGPITYQRASQVLVLTALLIIAGILLFRKRVTEGGAYLPLVALGIVSFLMLLTGVVATHFLLAIPFLLLIRQWTSGTAFWFIAITWTITTLVPMYGDMSLPWSTQSLGLLAPERNVVTRFVVWLYASDRFITVAIVANLCAMIWLGASALRPAASPVHAET